MHDRHWKIHWMLNFAQLSATLNLRAVMEETHGKVDEVLLGRLQNSANDRNWDKIRTLWEMKEEIKGDAELAQLFGAETAAEIVPALEASERGRRFIDERVVPYQMEYGWHAVWSHEFVFPSFREDMNPVIQLVRDQYASDYDYPTAIAELKADIDAAAVEILEGLEGEALEKMRAANDINLKMAPLTPDHHFYIDQGANAHVRLVLIAIGEKLVEMGALDKADDVVMFRYNQLRAFIGAPDSMDGRAIAAEAWARWHAAEEVQPKDWVGTATETQLAFPYLNLWGFPDKFHRSQEKVAGKVSGIAGSPGVVEGVARVVWLGGRVRQPAGGRDPRLPDDQPGLAGALRQDHRRGHRRRRHRLASGGPRPRVRHPGRGRYVDRDLRHQDGRSPPRRRQRRRGRDPARPAGQPPMTDDAEITRSVLSEQVKGRLLQAILDGRYPPGARIVETRVAKEFGTSQAPVREALRDLEALGVVETAPFKGARVRQPTTEELLEAFEVRAILEGHGAVLAVENVTEEDLDRLGVLVERHARGGHRGRPLQPRPPRTRSSTGSSCIAPGTPPSSASGARSNRSCGPTSPSSRPAWTGERSPTGTCPSSMPCAGRTPTSSKRPSGSTSRRRPRPWPRCGRTTAVLTTPPTDHAGQMPAIPI